MAIHKNTPKGLHVPNCGVHVFPLGPYGVSCANYDIIVLRSVHVGFSSFYNFLAIFDKDAFRRFMSELTATQIIDVGGC